ncbi:MAG TPA: glutathione peroxidase [Edaphobacter sp.]|jgi:glutathione peroxidase|nr:glutathione peroxidase [Edaphobacter sp.]
MNLRSISLSCVIGLVGLQIAVAQEKAPRQPKSAEAVPERGAGKDANRAEKPEKSEKTAYAYVLPGADGKDVPLSSFKGKVVLLVNLARNSSYNDQLPALIKLSETYKDKGLIVIGVPSNDFGAAEPGTDTEIQKFYKTDKKVPFPVMARAPLIGDEKIPLYDYLTKGKTTPPGGNVHWNYTKFLIDKNGKVITRLEPDVAPDSPEMFSTLDQIFSGTYKAKSKDDSAGPPSGDTQI